MGGSDNERATGKTLNGGLTQEDGVGNGNRTRNRWSHSPVLCQLSYSHRRTFIIAISHVLVPRREDRHSSDCSDARQLRERILVRAAPINHRHRHIQQPQIH